MKKADTLPDTARHRHLAYVFLVHRTKGQGRGQGHLIFGELAFNLGSASSSLIGEDPFPLGGGGAGELGSRFVL